MRKIFILFGLLISLLLVSCGKVKTKSANNIAYTTIVEKYNLETNSNINKKDLEMIHLTMTEDDKYYTNIYYDFMYQDKLETTIAIRVLPKKNYKKLNPDDYIIDILYWNIK